MVFDWFFETSTACLSADMALKSDKNRAENNIPSRKILFSILILQAKACKIHSN